MLAYGDAAHCQFDNEEGAENTQMTAEGHLV